MCLERRHTSVSVASIKCAVTLTAKHMTAVSRQHLVRDGQCGFVDTSSRLCSRRGSCSGYAVLRGEKAPDDALARGLGATGLL